MFLAIVYLAHDDHDLRDDVHHRGGAVGSDNVGEEVVQQRDWQESIFQRNKNIYLNPITKYAYNYKT